MFGVSNQKPRNSDLIGQLACSESRLLDNYGILLVCKIVHCVYEVIWSQIIYRSGDKETLLGRSLSTPFFLMIKKT